MSAKNRRLVNRYNIATNRWEMGYWIGNIFKVVHIAKAS